MNLIILALACGEKDSPNTADDTATDSNTGSTTTPNPTKLVDADGDGHDTSVDCDDNDALAYPGATEVCDGIDNDCNGDVDDDATDQGTYYLDADQDGFGDDSQALSACELPKGYATAGGDCDDGDDALHPNTNWYKDDDKDGFGGVLAGTQCDAIAAAVLDATDCADDDREVHPDAEEVCDSVDNNCDSVVDDDAIDRTEFYADADGDLYGDLNKPILACEQPLGTLTNSGDCDDSDDEVNPGEAEVECDGKDNNCDGTWDPSWVNVPQEYETIALALNNEGGDAQVCLGAGTFTSSEWITNADGALIQGQGAGETIWVTDGTAETLYIGGTMTIQDLTLNGGGDYGAINQGWGTLTLNDVEGTDGGCTGSSCRGYWAYVGGDFYANDLELHSFDINLKSSFQGLIAGVSGSANIDVDGFHIHDNRVEVTGSSPYITGFLYGWGTNTYRNGTIADNDLIAGQVIMMYASNVEFSDVDVIGNQIEGNEWNSWFGYNGGDHIWHRVRMLDNHMYAHGGGGPNYGISFANGDMLEWRNIIIAGNTFDTGTLKGERWYGWLMTSYETDVSIHNVDIAYNEVRAETITGLAGAFSSTNAWEMVNTNIVDNTAVDASSMSATLYTYSSGDMDYCNLKGDSPLTSGSYTYTSHHPDYVDVSAKDPTDWDLNLDSSSLLIDQGDPGILDVDGTRSDIGAHGGPDAW